MPKWDQHLRRYLFTEAEVTAIEGRSEAAAEPVGGRPQADLGIRKPTTAASR